MNAFTDEKQRSYIEQQLPPAAGSGGAPRGEAPFNLLTSHISQAEQGARGQTERSNTAQSLHSETHSYTSVPLRSLQKQGERLQKTKKHVALRTEFNTQVNKNPLEQNTYRNAN